MTKADFVEQAADSIGPHDAKRDWRWVADTLLDTVNTLGLARASVPWTPGQVRAVAEAAGRLARWSHPAACCVRIAREAGHVGSELSAPPVCPFERATELGLLRTTI